jgi:hypothetical protein
MKCPRCNTSVNILSSAWRTQPPGRSRKCPHCGGNVTNTFSGPISLAIIFLTGAIAVGAHAILPWFPMGAWGAIGAIALLAFAMQLKEAE